MRIRGYDDDDYVMYVLPIRSLYIFRRCRRWPGHTPSSHVFVRMRQIETWRENACTMHRAAAHCKRSLPVCVSFFFIFRGRECGCSGACRRHIKWTPANHGEFPSSCSTHAHIPGIHILGFFFFLVFINILVDWWSKLYNIGSGTHENPGAPTHPYWQNQYVLFRILGTECDVVEKHDGPYGGRTKWQLCRRHIYFNSQWHVVERLVLRLAALCLYTRFFLCVWMPCSIEPCSLRSVVGSSGVEWNRPSLAAHGAICVECQCAVCYDGRTSNCCRRIVAEQTEDGATMQIQLKCPMVKRQKPGCWTRCAQALHHRIEFPVHAKYTTHTRARALSWQK